jgi:hypothetical protein
LNLRMELGLGRAHTRGGRGALSLGAPLQRVGLGARRGRQPPLRLLRGAELVAQGARLGGRCVQTRLQKRGGKGGDE